MQFQITELKDFLSSITKHRVKNIQINSKNLKLIINANKLIEKNKFKPISKQKQNNLIKPQINITTNNTKTNIHHKPDAYFTIISPMIGTFYRSPAPNEPSFIEVNDSVKINQTVCIIEAMKLMNEIESEVNGHIVEILVKDGDIVDCGQALMRVKHK